MTFALCQNFKKKKRKELDSTKTYTHTSMVEKSIIDNHGVQSVRIAINIEENQDKLLTLLKVHKSHTKHAYCKHYFMHYE